MARPKRQQQQQQTTETKLSSPKRKGNHAEQIKVEQSGRDSGAYFWQEREINYARQKKGLPQDKDIQGLPEAEAVVAVAGAASAAEMGALNEWRRRRHCLRLRRRCRRRRSRIMLNLAVTQTLGKGSHTMAQ